MNWLTDFFTTVKKDEQWVVTEIAKGWQLLQQAGHTMEVDILGIFQVISQNHNGVLSLFNGVLAGLKDAGVLIPGLSPYVAAATTAIDAATAAIDVLSTGIQKGNTPLGTAANAYQKYKDAATAVNAVLKHTAAQPAPTK